MRVSSGYISKKTASRVWNVINEREITIEDYQERINEFMPRLLLTQSINLVIIIIMILKPNIEMLSL